MTIKAGHSSVSWAIFSCKQFWFRRKIRGCYICSHLQRRRLRNAVCWTDQKTRFEEHLLKNKTKQKEQKKKKKKKKKKKTEIDTFLYKHFRRAGHSWSSNKNFVQPVKKIINKSDSTERLKNTLRHEFELKWIKHLQTSFSLGLNDNIYHEGNVSKMPDFDVFFPFRY